MTTKLSARGADSKSNEEWKSRRHPETFDDGMTRCAEETLSRVKEMTTLCPAVQENAKKLRDIGGWRYAEMIEENAIKQAEWERERVKKVIESMAIYGREDCINRKELLKELGIEQEEKEK